MYKAPPPNYTQAPNAYFDEWLPTINSMSELKVINVVMRHTFGWHEDEVSLTVTDIQKLAGMSRASAIEGINRALKHGYIISRKNGRSRTFKIAVEPIGLESEPTISLNGPCSEPLNSPRSEPTQVSNGLGFEPTLGKRSKPPLNSKEKEKEKVRFASSKRKRATRDKRIEHPALKAILKTKGKYPHKDVWDLVISTVGESPDLARMRECWLAWRSQNYGPENLGWLLDWYVNGMPQRNGFPFKTQSNDPARRKRTAVRDQTKTDCADCLMCFGSGMEMIQQDGYEAARHCNHRVAVNQGSVDSEEQPAATVLSTLRKVS